MVEIENEASILSMFDTILSERYVTDLFACLRHIAFQFQYHLVTQQVVFDWHSIDNKIHPLKDGCTHHGSFLLFGC